MAEVHMDRDTLFYIIMNEIMPIAADDDKWTVKQIGDWCEDTERERPDDDLIVSLLDTLIVGQNLFAR